MSVLLETIQEGETHEFSVELFNEAAFEVFKVYWAIKATNKIIAKFAYPTTTGYREMTKVGDKYTCIVPKTITLGMFGATEAELHFVRSGKLEITPKFDFPTIARAISPTSN